MQTDLDGDTFYRKRIKCPKCKGTKHIGNEPCDNCINGHIWKKIKKHKPKKDI